MSKMYNSSTFGCKQHLGANPEKLSVNFAPEIDLQSTLTYNYGFQKLLCKNECALIEDHEYLYTVQGWVLFV